MAAGTLESEYEWTAHPARQRPRAALLALATIVALGLAASLLAPAPWGVNGRVAVAVISAGALVLALHKFYFPSRFRLDADGITARHLLGTRRCRWADLKRFVHDHDGGFLSTRARGSWLDRYTGMHILFGPERASVISLIRDRVSAGSPR